MSNDNFCKENVLFSAGPSLMNGQIIGGNIVCRPMIIQEKNVDYSHYYRVWVEKNACSTLYGPDYLHL